MSIEKTTELYDAYYFATGCGNPYQRDETWMNFFDGIARHIIKGIKPGSVLDAGCAMGFLVEKLRLHGVEAFGVDVSEYAIQNVHPDIAPYCRVGSVTEPFSQNYDLIVCIEVLEHIPKEEGEAAVANFCQYTDDILFSSTPFDYKEATHFNVQPPEYWAALFGQYGFVRDVDFDATFITPWAIRFRRTNDPLIRTISAYERRMWQLLQRSQGQQELSLELRRALAEKEELLTEKETELLIKSQTEQQLRKEVKEWEGRWKQIKQSPGWALLNKLQGLRGSIAPPRSIRDQFIDDIFRAWHHRSFQPLRTSMHRVGKDLTWRKRSLTWQIQLKLNPPKQGEVIIVDEIAPRPPLQSHQTTVEIVICVHNALDDVKRCLTSILNYTTSPYHLILVDDGSDWPTWNYLAKFSKEHSCVLLRNEDARGYTIAANRGLRHTSADYVVLLNSDTVVTEGWLDRLVACAESNPKIGLVGPLSNTASWQSIPNIEENGDWAANLLPTEMSIAEMGRLVAYYSNRLYPLMPFLNGFCILIRQEVIQEVGLFDEENFGAGYGEENDYALRVRKAGWGLAVADDTYIYHAQSRSYSHDRRKILSEQANVTLAKKHGQNILSEGVAVCRHDRVLQGIRTRSQVMLARQEWLKRGREKFAGKRVLFILPLFTAAGGGNVVIDEAMSMHNMDVEAHIFNLTLHQDGFQKAYPEIELPVRYGEPEHLTQLAHEYDAIIATSNFSVKWLVPITEQEKYPVLGYYVQDFEPYLFPENSEGYQEAWQSYTLIPDLVCFTKTQWNRQEVKNQTGVDCDIVGSSLNIDLFCPRPRLEPEWPDHPLKIVAMVRAKTSYRNPKLTMTLLRQAAQQFKGAVEITIFGTKLEEVEFADLPRDFPWRLAGTLNRRQVANLLNEADIFVDFSAHQAMGLTALEAMACGAAVIVPERGGTDSFANHEENCLVVDTASADDCWNALKKLITIHDLRTHLQQNALADACQFFSEQSAFKILSALFDPTNLDDS